MTNDGEVQVSITLELNINLNADGLQVSAQATEVKKEKIVEPTIKDDWLIPDFGDSPKVNFGKKE